MKQLTTNPEVKVKALVIVKISGTSKTYNLEAPITPKDIQKIAADNGIVRFKVRSVEQNKTITPADFVNGKYTPTLEVETFIIEMINEAA